MSNDIYHSITQIPTFITKTGLNLINNYPDRYSQELNSMSDCSVESYYADGYYGDSYESLQGLDYDSASHLDIEKEGMDELEKDNEEKIKIGSKENENENENEQEKKKEKEKENEKEKKKEDGKEMKSRLPLDAQDSIHHENLKQSVSSAVSVDFPKNRTAHSCTRSSQSPSQHCYCSCHSSTSSVTSNGSNSSSSDQSSDPDTQKTRYIIKKIKKLILINRNNSHIIANNEDYDNGIGNIVNSSNNTMSKYNNTLNHSKMVDTPEKIDSNIELNIASSPVSNLIQSCPQSFTNNITNKIKLESNQNKIAPKISSLPGNEIK
ncbi:hypothetical protein U3516DRAFT_796756 [Neocallimastix sp. 'constans']